MCFFDWFKKQRQQQRKNDNRTARAKPEKMPSEGATPLSSAQTQADTEEQSPQQEISLTAAELRRATEDREFLATKLGVSPDDPKVAEVQAQLRQMLQQEAESQESADKQQGISFTPEELRRAAEDREFLATKLGVSPDDPKVAQIQAQLRQMLQQEVEQQTESQSQPTASAPLQEWMGQSSYQSERIYLEQHPTLVSKPTEDELRMMLDMIPQQRPHLIQQGQSEQTIQKFLEIIRRYVRVITYAYAHGGSTEAIRDAYVNAMGGFLLEIPSWLEELQANQPPSPEQQAHLWAAALARAEQERLAAPIRAEIAARLGNTLNGVLTGDQASIREQRIAALTYAGAIYTQEQYPWQWAGTQNNLGIDYKDRIRGERAENLELAIVCYTNALQVRTREAAPLQWATTQTNLGNAYLDRIRGERAENLEQAIACYTNALLEYTREAAPLDWAMTQNNLGAAYFKRIRGERAENLEQAIACYTNALLEYTRAAAPLDWAVTQNNLGAAYAERIRGERAENLEQAIACYTNALLERQLETNPHNFRLTQHNVAKAEGQRNNWSAVAAAYAAALQAEELLLELGGGEHGVDDILRQHTGAAAGAAFALARLGRNEAAILTAERGRARSLARARNLHAADPNRITDSALREQFIAAQRRLQETQRLLNTPIAPSLPDQDRRVVMLERGSAFAQAKQSFDAVVAAIRARNAPGDFLLDSVAPQTLWLALHRCGVGHALIYLIVTEWGGVALLARADGSGSLQYAVLELPELTEQFIGEKIEQELPDSSRIIGGYAHAQAGAGFALFSQCIGDSFAAKAEALHASCRAAGQVSMLDRAAQHILQDPIWQNLTNVPLEHISAANRKLYLQLQAAFNAAFLRLEADRVLRAIGRAILQPLADWLPRQGITQVTLIPTDALAALPLLAAPINNTAYAVDWETFGDRFTASVAPSARALIPDEHRLSDRNGFAGVGNPQEKEAPLKWGEAEPQSLKQIFQQVGVTTNVAVREQATKQWFLKAIKTARIFEASCHGSTDFKEYLNSCLFLSDGQVTLADAFNGVMELHGLRLLILSACQTAIMDLRGARDETRSLAMGMIQAGAEAALASFWSVDDLATYLLMTRFAQEWAKSMEYEPPAAAFARAQRWLRAVTYRELLTWEMKLPEEAITNKGADRNGDVAVRAPNVAVPLESVWLLDQLQRYTSVEAQGVIHIHFELEMEKNTIDLNDRPYSDPFYWAAFQVYGW